MRILVPVDGSPHSDKAVETLAAASNWLNPDLIMLLNVVQPLESFMPFKVDDSMITREQEIIAKRSTWLMERANFLAGAFAASPLVVDYRVKFGHPKEVIVNMAARRKYDLIFLGSHGRSGVERLLLGSVSQAVLELAPSAVLIAKTDQGQGESPLSRFQRVLVPYDGSVYSRDTINWLCQQNFGPQTKFHLVMAVTDFEKIEKLDLTEEQEMAVRSQWTMIKQRAFDILEDVALSLGKLVGNENVSIDAIPGDPREIIYQEMEEFGADLIALGSHGRTGLEKMMLGSISLHIAQHAAIPVLVVRRMTNVELPFDDELVDDEPYSDEEIRSGREDRPPFTMF